MSSLLLTDTGARRGRVRVSRGGRRVVVPLAEYRAGRAGEPALRHADPREGHADPREGYADPREGYADGAGFVADADEAGGVAGSEPAAGRAAHPRTAGDGPSGERPLRLTRRGRVVVRLLAGAALLLVVAVGVLGDRTALAGAEPSGAPVLERVVLPGETLWAIAGEVAPDSDRRDTVAQIIELNDLSSAEVRAGQRLAVPAPTR